MKLIKRHLCRLPSCYAVSSIELDGRLHYLFATDDAGSCYCIDAQTLRADRVWEEPGGTMSLVPLPGTNGEFLASQRFLPGFKSLRAEIVRVGRRDGKWKVSPWLKLPYVHRFDLLERGGAMYFLGCILSSTQEEHADWSCPGTLAAAELTSDFSAPAGLTRIASGMTRNHGYCRVERDGYTMAFTACDEGVFTVVPPEARGGLWEVRKVLDVPCSDIALCDLDGDGVDELAAIEPFHGSEYVVYKLKDGAYREIYRYPHKMGFVHAIWGGVLLDTPVFFGGCRAENKELFYLKWEDGAVREHIVELGYGPSNIHVVNEPGRPQILVANRESGECAVFTAERQEGGPG